jgi:hypothetical protein
VVAINAESASLKIRLFGDSRGFARELGNYLALGWFRGREYPFAGALIGTEYQMRAPADWWTMRLPDFTKSGFMVCENNALH